MKIPKKFQALGSRSRQLDLFEPAESVAGQPEPAKGPESTPLVTLVREQILRDYATLRMDPIFHAPSADFYRARIESFTTYLHELENDAR